MLVSGELELSGCAFLLVASLALLGATEARILRSSSRHRLALS